LQEGRFIFIVVLIKEDGIWPDIADSVEEIFIAAKVSITWNEKYEGLNVIDKHLPVISEDTFEVIQKYEIPIIKMETEL